MNKLDARYQGLLKEIIEWGVKKKTRNGEVLSVFGRQIHHNMKDGFPLITTKKMAFKTMVTELLYFLRGETSIKYLVENNCNIWNGDLAKHHNVSINDYVELAKNDENLYEGGALYPHQWRHYGFPYYNRKRVTVPFKTYFYKCEINTQSEDDNVGKIFSTKDYGDYVVLDKLKKGSKNESHYQIQFLNTNATKTIRADKLNTNVCDSYAPSKHGVACVGDYNNATPNCDKLKIIWNGMIDRCYDSKKDKYAYYGGKGVYVDNTWLCFEYFLDSVQKLPNWKLKLENWDEYQLDKDSIGDGYVYSLNSCCWLHKNDNMKKSKEKYKFTVTNGFFTHEFINHVDFIQKFEIKNSGNFSSMLRGERQIAEGWKLISKEKINDGIDQIANLIKELKSNPDSRRLLVSAWNASDLPHQILPPCHYGFQMYTRELSLEERAKWLQDTKGYDLLVGNLEHDHIREVVEEESPTRAISLMWTQRSVDTGLGLSFNIASYALLLMMIAKQVNMIPDQLIGNLGDVHLYSNHIEPIKEQLTRTPYELPTVKISDRLVNDVSVTNLANICYKIVFQIKMPLSN